MEVRRQQANYRCTLYRLQFCGSFQDMCRCRAFQMLHTQQSSSHPLGPSTMLYQGLNGSTTKAQTCPQKNAGQQSTCSSQSRCCVSWEGYRIPEAVEPWALHPGMVYCGAMAALEKETHIYLPSGKPGNSTASHIYMRCFTCFPLR